jgi:rhamnosyltransferase
MTAAVSVVIRAKDEADAIGRTLDLVKAQTVEAELIVVDSGSTDGTGDIAREHGAEVIWIPAAEFTFGGSLNLGTSRATAPIVVALSAHAYPRDQRWLERMLSAFEDPKVACAVGAETGPDGEQIAGRLKQDEAMARRNPVVGYSNASGAFRRELWEQYEFRPDMPGTEDKEWSWHWLQRGYVCVLAPDLTVDHDHTKDPLRDTWVRARREWIGYGMYIDLPAYPVREALADWRTGARKYRHPLNILREGVRVAGAWSVRRRG